MKRSSPEHRLQVALMDYLQLAGRKDLHWTAIPNQSNRHIANAAKMKAEGLKAGTPDVVFLLPEGKVAWLELKAAKGVLSEGQKAFRDKARALGHLWGMAKDIEQAVVLVSSWDVLRPSYSSLNAFYDAAEIRPNLARVL